MSDLQLKHYLKVRWFLQSTSIFNILFSKILTVITDMAEIWSPAEGLLLVCLWGIRYRYLEWVEHESRNKNSSGGLWAVARVWRASSWTNVSPCVSSKLREWGKREFSQAVGIAFIHFPCRPHIASTTPFPATPASSLPSFHQHICRYVLCQKHGIQQVTGKVNPDGFYLCIS